MNDISGLYLAEKKAISSANISVTIIGIMTWSMEQTAALPVIISSTIKSLMLAVETTNTQTMRIKRALEAKSTDH